MPPELGSGDSVPLRRVVVYLDPQTPPHLLGEVATGLTSPPNIAPVRSAGLRAAGVDEENKALVLTFDGTSGRDDLRYVMSLVREKVSVACVVEEPGGRVPVLGPVTPLQERRAGGERCATEL